MRTRRIVSEGFAVSILLLLLLLCALFIPFDPLHAGQPEFMRAPGASQSRLPAPARSRQGSPPADCAALSPAPYFARARRCRMRAGSAVTGPDRPECIAWGSGFPTATRRRPRRFQSPRPDRHRSAAGGRRSAWGDALRPVPRTGGDTLSAPPASTCAAPSGGG